MTPARADTSFEDRLAHARAGRGDVLGDLLEAYRNYLRLLAGAQVGAQLRATFDPSDLVQETVLEAYRDFGQFAGASEQEFTAWLRRVLVRNLADEIKRQRAQRRDNRRQESLEALLCRSSESAHEALAAQIVSPSGQVRRREEAVVLADALAELSKDHREVIVLRNLQRLKFDEIGAHMGRTSGAVRKLWARALLRLREILEEV